MDAGRGLRCPHTVDEPPSRPDRVRVCVYVCICECVCVYVCIRVCRHAYVLASVCACVRMYVIHVIIVVKRASGEWEK